MAKLVIEFDTVSKVGSASMDGAAIPNFLGAHFYGDSKGKFGCEVVSGAKDEDNDMWSVTRVCAEDGSMVEKKIIDDELDEETENEVKEFFGIIDDA